MTGPCYSPCAKSKLNISFRLPEIASKEPPLIRCPPSQLSSMKRMIEAWFGQIAATKLARAQGEITSMRQPLAVTAAHRPS